MSKQGKSTKQRIFDYGYGLAWGGTGSILGYIIANIGRGVAIEPTIYVAQIFLLLGLALIWIGKRN